MKSSTERSQVFYGGVYCDKRDVLPISMGMLEVYPKGSKSYLTQNVLNLTLKHFVLRGSIFRDKNGNYVFENLNNEPKYNAINNLSYKIVVYGKIDITKVHGYIFRISKP